MPVYMQEMGKKRDYRRAIAYLQMVYLGPYSEKTSR